MENPLKVLISGDTLVLGCLQASLKGHPGLELCDIDPLTASQHELVALQPQVVIFDLGSTQPAFQYTLAEQLPGLLLVGIDPVTNRVVVWSAQEWRELSTSELVEVIGRQARQEISANR